MATIAFVPGKILVAFKEGTPESTRKQILKGYLWQMSGSDIYKISVIEGAEMKMVEYFKSLSVVKFSEPLYVDTGSES